MCLPLPCHIPTHLGKFKKSLMSFVLSQKYAVFALVCMEENYYIIGK